jgi:hypothetical protein
MSFICVSVKKLTVTYPEGSDRMVGIVPMDKKAGCDCTLI